MKIVVVHDLNGKIKTLAKVNPGSPYGIGAVPGPGDLATEIELDASLANLGLHEIHAKYVVDGTGTNKKLVPRRG
jgi:hypothetical protein